MRKRKPQPTPLLDWLESQPAQADIGSSWIGEIGTIVPKVETTSPCPEFKVGDLVECRQFEGTQERAGRQPWKGWIGEIADIEGDVAFIRYDDYPLYRIRLSLIEWVQDAEVVEMYAESPPESPSTCLDPVASTNHHPALKEWRWWPAKGQWTFTGFMGLDIEPTRPESKVFPAGIDPNLLAINHE